MQLKAAHQIALVALAGIVFIAFGFVVLIADPFSWGVVTASRFSWEEFDSIQVGEPIEAVVKRLGEPIQEPESLIVLTEDPKDPCFQGGCRKFLFAGARFGSSFKEAVVIVDRSGVVVHAVARQE